jgi:hypothetical protein
MLSLFLPSHSLIPFGMNQDDCRAVECAMHLSLLLIPRPCPFLSRLRTLPPIREHRACRPLQPNQASVASLSNHSQATQKYILVNSLWERFDLDNTASWCFKPARASHSTHFIAGTDQLYCGRLDPRIFPSLSPPSNLTISR